MELYYIVSLHQTTTMIEVKVNEYLLYYIVSLHQTTTQRDLITYLREVVLYRFSTSNHNNQTCNL